MLQCDAVRRASTPSVLSRQERASSMSDRSSAGAGNAGPGFVEFVCLISMMMALNSLAIDTMLPALPKIGAALGVVSANSRQWVITAYLLGMGLAQIIYGPFSDRFGRKPVLMVGLVLYVLFGLLATLAPTFETMILARLGQGIGAAATRVLGVSLIRDRYKGAAMARVMSLNFLVFLGVPILAPSLGQAILLVAPWRTIFGMLVVAGVAVLTWTLIRLPETLRPERRMPIEVRRIALAFREACSHRAAIGYTLAMTAMIGALLAYINSAQQIFFDVFKAPALFTTVFALLAGGIAAASVLNARFVHRFGARAISHGAVIGFTVVASVHAMVALAGHETIWTFAPLQFLAMFCFGLMVGNFGALSMESMGHIAGTAASAQGFVSTTAGSLIGLAIGQMFDGTVVPFAVGATVLGMLAVAAVLFAEEGRLFGTGDAIAVPAASG
jgi:DHA1 family bicyclomycin/chloramphenicol resistance-like MFS transporter